MEAVRHTVFLLEDEFKLREAASQAFRMMRIHVYKMPVLIGFLEETKANEEFRFGGLGIQSLNSTASLSGTQTPSQDPNPLKQETLGKGAFVVMRRF